MMCATPGAQACPPCGTPHPPTLPRRLAAAGGKTLHFHVQARTHLAATGVGGTTPDRSVAGINGFHRACRCRVIGIGTRRRCWLLGKPGVQVVPLGKVEQRERQGLQLRHR